MIEGARLCERAALAEREPGPRVRGEGDRSDGRGKQDRSHHEPCREREGKPSATAAQPGAAPDRHLEQMVREHRRRHGGAHAKREERQARQSRSLCAEHHEDRPVPEVQAVGDRPDVADRTKREQTSDGTVGDQADRADQCSGGDGQQKESPAIGPARTGINDHRHRADDHNPDDPEATHHARLGGGESSIAQQGSRWIRSRSGGKGSSEDDGQGSTDEERLHARVGPVVVARGAQARVEEHAHGEGTGEAQRNRDDQQAAQ